MALLHAHLWIAAGLFLLALSLICLASDQALKRWADRHERILIWCGNRLARKYVRSQGET